MKEKNISTQSFFSFSRRCCVELNIFAFSAFRSDARCFSSTIPVLPPSPFPRKEPAIKNPGALPKKRAKPHRERAKNSKLLQARPPFPSHNPTPTPPPLRGPNLLEPCGNPRGEEQMSARLRVEELRAALLSRGLDVSGTKNALVSPPAFPQVVRSVPQQSPNCYSRPILAALCAVQPRE